VLSELWQSIKEVISWLRKSGLESSELYIKLSEISTKVALMREPPVPTKEFEENLKQAFEVINGIRKDLSQGSFSDAVTKLSKLSEVITRLEKSSRSATLKFALPFISSALLIIILTLIFIIYLQVYSISATTYIVLMLSIAIAMCLAFSAIIASFLHARISALALLSSVLILIGIITYIYPWNYTEFWISLTALSLVGLETLFIIAKGRRIIIKLQMLELPEIIPRIEIESKTPAISKELKDMYKKLEKHYVEIYGSSGLDILRYEITCMMRAGLSYEESLKKLWERLGNRGKFVSSAEEQRT